MIAVMGRSRTSPLLIAQDWNAASSGISPNHFTQSGLSVKSHQVDQANQAFIIIPRHRQYYRPKYVKRVQGYFVKFRQQWMGEFISILAPDQKRRQGNMSRLISKSFLWQFLTVEISYLIAYLLKFIAINIIPS